VAGALANSVSAKGHAAPAHPGTYPAVVAILCLRDILPIDTLNGERVEITFA
jgi:hypothetical protein